MQTPKVTEAIKNEGAMLHHCVGSYVDHILNSELIILFLRNDESTPRVTLEVRVNPHHKTVIDSVDKNLGIQGYILQAQGVNGSNLETCELKAISEFCKYAKLKFKRD